MYVVAEEDNENSDGDGPIVILSSNWLTPKKAEALWPTTKIPAIFNRLLKNHENPKEDWTLIKIKRKFYEADDLLVARKKAQQAEITSDLTDGEICGTRKRYKSKRVESSSSGDDDIFNKHKTRKLTTKDIFGNPGTCELNASFIEGHCSPLFASSQPPSPDRLPAKKSGTCELNASLIERHCNPSGIPRLGHTKNTVIGSPISSLTVTASLPIAAQHTSTTLSAAKTGTCELNASLIERHSDPLRILGSGHTNNPGIGSPYSSLPVTASSPIAAHHTTTLSAAKTAYEYNVIQMLTIIKEQNTVILEWIRKQNSKEFQIKNSDLQLPVEFPLNDYEQLQQLELFLASNQNFTDLCEYFGEFAGPTVTGTVNGILKHTLTNHLAATYSFRGKKGKRAFEDLTLKTAIVRAVKKICNVVRDQPIEDDMKVWLKHAPQRIILQDKKIRARLDRIA